MNRIGNNLKTTSNQNDYLFVYGTLMQGGELHKHLDHLGVRFIGEGRIKARLFKIPGEDYPGAIPSTVQTYVHGELYHLRHPSKTLKKIDKIEGCDEGLFTRDLVDVWIERNRVKAWAYFYAEPLQNAKPIRSGRYREL